MPQSRIALAVTVNLDALTWLDSHCGAGRRFPSRSAGAEWCLSQMRCMERRGPRPRFAAWTRKAPRRRVKLSLRPEALDDVWSSSDPSRRAGSVRWAIEQMHRLRPDPHRPRPQTSRPLLRDRRRDLY